MDQLLALAHLACLRASWEAAQPYVGRAPWALEAGAPRRLQRRPRRVGLTPLPPLLQAQWTRLRLRSGARMVGGTCPRLPSSHSHRLEVRPLPQAQSPLSMWARAMLQVQVQAQADHCPRALPASSDHRSTAPRHHSPPKTALSSPVLPERALGKTRSRRPPLNSPLAPKSTKPSSPLGRTCPWLPQSPSWGRAAPRAHP